MAESLGQIPSELSQKVTIKDVEEWHVFQDLKNWETKYKESIKSDTERSLDILAGFRSL